MIQCQKCGGIKFYSFNFIFSKFICNECYLVIKEKEDRVK